MSDRVVVVGQGYVGLPVAMRAVGVGYDVIGLDLDERRISWLRQGESYVHDVSSTALQEALTSGRYTPTDSYVDATGFDYAVVTVPTPLRDGSPDLTFIENSMAALAPYLTVGATVVLESTTYPGTTENLAAPLLEQGSGLKAGVDFYLGYSPERIDPGNQRWTFVNTPKVVSGVNAESLSRVQAFYDTLVDTTVPVSGTREAETTKLLENTFRHVNIALVNELAIFSHQLGINLMEAIDAASTKPFGYLRFTPGPGVGGHCLPVDPSYLSWEVTRKLGRMFRFVELANDVNRGMPAYVVARLSAALNRRRQAMNGSRVMLLGLGYKPNSGDCRESPALKVAELLLELGASVAAVDAFVDARHVPAAVDLVKLTAETVAAADLVVLLTDHDGVPYDLLSQAALVFDTRHRLTGESVESL